MSLKCAFADFMNVKRSAKVEESKTVALQSLILGIFRFFRHFQDEKKQIARNLYVQSQVIKNFYALDIFKNYNLVVAEGLYQAGPDETPTGFNDLAQTGRAVAYEVYSADGVIALDKLYDYAEFLKDTFSYDKIGLAYDTYNKNGRVHGQLIVEIPTIPSSFTATFSMKLETTFNGEIQSSSDLVEIVYK